MPERFRRQVRRAPARPSFKQMPETVQQYVQRLQTYLGDRDPLRVQAATVARIEKLLKGVPISKVRKRPAPGKWSIAEILAHLADNELVRSYRIKSILGLPGTAIAAYDQDRWESQDYARRDPKMSLRVLRVLREADLALLKSLRPEQWKQSGIHAERGVESVESLVRIGAGHDLNHIMQIEAILKAKARKPLSR
jgi:hypothetical protein